ncbi:MAG: hypothetical protein GXP31_05230 [Kiritimatiellaeota bacterium]|nr:hypothetical protein [Kiritimatiellota bacterium]
MNRFLFRTVSAATFLLGGLLPLRGASRLNGRVYEQPGHRSVPFAVVRLDLVPGDGVAEYTTQTDVFGFFDFDSVVSGDYELQVDHPAYAPAATPIVLVEGVAGHATVPLIRTAVETYLTVFFDVSCAQSFARLKDARITVRRWTSSDTSVPPEATYSLKASPLGAGTLSGIEPGFFVFDITRTGWTPMRVPDSGARFLARDNLVTVAMDPILADLSVTVKGTRTDRDPPEVDQPLVDAQISITGVDFGTATDELTGARTAMPTGDGAFTFRAIPPIPRRVRVQRLGYRPFETVVQPNAAGGYDPLAVDLALANQAVTVVLNSIYTDPKVLEGAEVNLRGFADSSTEGISRKTTTLIDGRDRVVAVFNQLLPGRYWVHVKHTGRLVALPEFSGNAVMWDGRPGVPGFPEGDTDIEVQFLPREIALEVAYDEKLETPVEMVPVPAVLRGRLLATGPDQRIDPWLLYDFDPLERIDPRIFRPMHQEGIRIESQAGSDLFREGPLQAVVSSDTDGYFSTLLPPGRYGIRIPGMTEYTGHHSIIRDNPEDPSARTRTGWPFPAEWPWPDWEEEHHLGWLQMDSAQRISIDLFLHRQTVNLKGRVRAGATDPIESAVLLQDSSGAFVDATVFDLNQYGPGTVTAVGPVTQTVPIVRDPNPNAGANPVFLLRDLPAGSYTLSVQHPRYTSVSPVQLLIAPWAPPGEPPPVDPVYTDPTYMFPGVTHDIGWGFPLEPEYNSPGSVQVDFQRWEQTGTDWNGNPIYKYVKKYFGTSQIRSTFFFQPFFSQSAFHAAPDSTTSNSFFAPAGGAFKVWVRSYASGNWFFADSVTAGMELQVRDQGPDNNMFPGHAPWFVAGHYEVEIHGVNADYPDQEIAGVTGKLTGNVNSFTTTGDDDAPVTADSMYSVGVFDVQPPAQWVYESWAASLIRLEPLPARYRIDLSLRRGMTVAGTVHDHLGQPVAGASVRVLHRRSGNSLAEGVADSNGAFLLGNFNIQPVYIEVRAPGFVPHRQRLAPASPDQADLNTGTIALVPLPPPTISEFALDRFGLFVPGVLKSGDAGGFNADNALSGLTATWSVATVSATVDVTLPGYDDAGGTPQSTSFSINDEIMEVWLVDKRWFEKPLVANTTQTQAMLTAPAPLTESTFRAFLKQITDAERDGADFFVIHSPGTLRTPPDAREATRTFEGTLKLHELPAGDFMPMVFVVTKYGVVTTADYRLPAGKKKLQGIRFPKWAATILEVIGMAATFAPDVDPSNVVPVGRFVPLPSFSSGLDLNPLTGYLTYEYRIGVQMIEGGKAPAAGPLALGPKTLGLGYKGEIGFKVNGENSTVELLAAGTVEKDSKEAFTLYTPAFLKGIFTVDSASVSGTLTRTIVQNLNPDFLDQDRAPDYRYRTKAGAFVKIRLLRDLTPLIEKFPAGGVLLGGLGRSGALVFNGVLDIGVGGGVERTSETFFPTPAEFGTVVPGQAPPVWHLLGGAGQTETVNKFNVQILAGVGINVTALSKNVSGSLIAQLGPPKDIVGQKGLKFTLNTRPEWPLITRVEGAFQLNGEVGVNLWGVKLSRSFNLHETRIDWRPGGAGGARNGGGWYDIVALDNSETVVTPALSPPAWFIGDTAAHEPAETVAADLPGGRSAALAGSGLAFVSTDNGEMTVRFALRSDTSWGTSNEIARAGVVLGVAAIALGDGGFLLVWTAIDADQLGDPFPNAGIWHARLDDTGAVIAGPTTLASAVGAAAVDPRLAPVGERILLVFAKASDGPMSDLVDLQFAVYDPVLGDWTAPPASIDVPRRLASWAMTGTAEVAVEPSGALLTVDDNGLTQAWMHTAGVWTGPTTVSDEAGRCAAVTVDETTGRFVAAIEDPTGVLRLWTLDATRRDVWRVLPGNGVTAAGLTALAVAGVPDGAAGTAFLLAWGAGGAETALFYALIRPDGELLAGPSRASDFAPGSIDRVMLETAGTLSATVFATRSTTDGGTAIEAPIAPGTDLPTGPAVRTFSPDKLVTEGAWTHLRVEADHAGALQIQWTKDDEPIQSAGTSTLEFRGIGPEDAGVYRAVLVDRNGIATAGPVRLGVTSDMVLELQPGWNLVGFPANGELSLAQLLAGTTGRGTLALGPVWAWDAATQSYAALAPDVSPPARVGLWVYSPTGGLSRPSPRTTAGSPPATLPGWNLYTPDTTGPMPEGVAGVGAVFDWDGRRYLPVRDTDAPALFILRSYWIFGAR